MATDDSWKTQHFRQSVVAKIDEAIQVSGMLTTKNSMEMENHVFQKAKTKEEYVGFVARLILHVKEMNSKKGAAGNAPGTAGTNNQGMPDLIGALQTLARQGTGNNQMMGMGGPGPNHQGIIPQPANTATNQTSLDSSNEFSALRSPDELYSDKETVSPVEFSQTLKQKEVLPVTNLKIVSPNREIVSPTQCKNTLPSLLVDSPSKIANSAAMSVHSSLSNIPTKLAKKVKRKSTADDEIDDSFVKLTSAVTTHFEKKNQSTISSEVLQLDEDIFGKTVACQLKKIAEPEKTKIKGQIMKILYNL